MNLQEIAFMVSLINANYRRRMLYFWGNALVIIVALVVMNYSNVFLGFTLLLASLLRIFNLTYFGPSASIREFGIVLICVSP